MKHFLRIIFSIFCLLGITCSFLPAAEAGLISEKQELEMGKAAAEQIEARYRYGNRGTGRPYRAKSGGCVRS